MPRGVRHGPTLVIHMENATAPSIPAPSQMNQITNDTANQSNLSPGRTTRSNGNPLSETLCASRSRQSYFYVNSADEGV